RLVAAVGHGDAGGRRGGASLLGGAAGDGAQRGIARLGERRQQAVVDLGDAQDAPAQFRHRSLAPVADIREGNGSRVVVQWACPFRRREGTKEKGRRPCAFSLSVIASSRTPPSSSAPTVKSSTTAAASRRASSTAAPSPASTPSAAAPGSASTATASSSP